MLKCMDALAQAFGEKPLLEDGTPVNRSVFNFYAGPFQAYFSDNDRNVVVMYSIEARDSSNPDDALISEDPIFSYQQAQVPWSKDITPESLLEAFGDAVVRYDDFGLNLILALDLPFLARIAIADALERDADAIDVEANRLLTRAKDRRSLSTKQYLRAEK